MARKKKNIYRLDNFALGLSLFFFGMALLMAVGARGPGPARVLIPLFFLSPAAGLFWLGRRFRKKEKNTRAVLRHLEIARDVSISEMVSSTGFSRAEIEEAVRTINRQGLGYFVLADDRIMDGRLRRQMVFVDTCGDCGRRIGRYYSLQLNEVPKCPNCGNPLNISQWNEFVSREYERMDQAGGGDQTVGEEGELSIPILIILCVVFWPAAIYYVVSRKK